MKIVAIGAGGFLGRMIVNDLLMMDVDVTVGDFKPKPADWDEKAAYSRLDITDFEKVKQLVASVKPEAILNLAALLTGLCEQEPYQATRVNVMGNANVLEAARINGVKRVVMASSAGVSTPDRADGREERLISPLVSMYGATKFYNEVLGRVFSRDYGLEAVSLRYSLIYGPGEVASAGNAKRLKDIESCVSGQDVIIDDATGMDRAHLLHAEDAARATVAALTTEKAINGVYNISGFMNDFLSFQDIVDILRAEFPQAGKVIFKGQNKPQELGLYPYAKAREAFGYSPSIHAKDGLIANARQRLAKAAR